MSKRNAYRLFEKLATVRASRETRRREDMADSLLEAKLLDELQQIDMAGRDSIHCRIDWPRRCNVYVGRDTRHGSGRLFCDISPVIAPGDVLMLDQDDDADTSIEDVSLVQSWAKHSVETGVS